MKHNLSLPDADDVIGSVLGAMYVCFWIGMATGAVLDTQTATPALYWILSWLGIFLMPAITTGLVYATSIYNGFEDTQREVLRSYSDLPKDTRKQLPKNFINTVREMTISDCDQAQRYLGEIAYVEHEKALTDPAKRERIDNTLDSLRIEAQVRREVQNQMKEMY